jgi:transaldolase
MATEVEQLIKRVDALKGEKAKAQGVVESIQKKWLAEFGTDDPEKIREIVKKIEGDVEKLSSSYNATLDEARELIAQAENSIGG